MHTITAIILSFLMLSGTTFAVELSEASNQQIFDELSRRMQSGGGGATINFICSGSGYLKIEQDNSLTLNIGNYETCSEQQQLWSSAHQFIRRNTTIAACSGSAYLYRFKATPSGRLSKIDNGTSIGSYQRCMEQAKNINGV